MLYSSYVHYFFTISITKVFSKWQKIITFNIFSKSLFNWISHFYNNYPIVNVKFTSSSVSSALLAWSVKKTSITENSVLTLFIIVKECGEIFINCPNCFFGAKLNTIFDVCWQSFLTKLQWSKTTSTDSNFGTFSLFLSKSPSFFILSNNLLVSRVTNSNL